MNASQSKTVLDSGILAVDFGPGYWNPDFLLVELRFRIAIVNGDYGFFELYSAFCRIPNFHQQRFPSFRNPFYEARMVKHILL